ncbi:hypothetical protein [Rhodococcus pyridinivorans]|uniref:hypothetical protein n=1 Tax=Rhodococcus pyridinivorans TaxID=103816 RepID=UPI00110D8B94|nr:hypothetical protein [Rhodococcus pyridinivorans]
MTKPRKPRGLGAEGTKLWETITDRYELEEYPEKLRILFDACKTADTIKRLDDEADREPLTVKGSMGQKVIHPCIAHAQTARGQLAQLLGKLQLPATDDDEEARQEELSRTRSGAAKARFRSGG